MDADLSRSPAWMYVHEEARSRLVQVSQVVLRSHFSLRLVSGKDVRGSQRGGEDSEQYQATSHQISLLQYHSFVVEIIGPLHIEGGCGESRVVYFVCKSCTYFLALQSVHDNCGLNLCLLALVDSLVFSPT
jgi:hypothetical protein